MKEKYEGMQIGRTKIQKMMYLLGREDMLENYSMYHYGPYSNEVSGELSFAEISGIIESTWDTDSGYSIKPTPQLDKFESFLDETERESIDVIVERYGKFMTKDLSIISTALYLRDNFNVPAEDLIESVHELKRKQPISHIENVLKETGVI